MIDVTDELRKYKIINEGEAEILMHSNNTVFFNKAQVLCLCCLRFDVTEDISKECIKTPFWKDPRELKAPRVLKALAASGLRALRYAREVDGIGQVIALDNDKVLCGDNEEDCHSK
ncbi:hypothetical protein B296_00002637 [Ensete ventricosum]|uniref:tRNA (guanine(26)-N(2))-dimethyltransferase n=1 Tax=Ensete ventricosum TaxID=4639 RepID=A0A427B9M6_ENSVE|nr:hypothetical protein B296_00002637 [Ensete ventricosum]